MNRMLEPIRSPKTPLLDAHSAAGRAARFRSITASGNRPSGAAGEQATPPTGLEMVGEVADLAVGLGMLTLTLATARV